MKFTLLFLFLICGILSAQNPQLDWVISQSGSGNQIAYSIASDSKGNLIHTGYFKNTVDFDPGPALANLTSAGGNDIFVAKYDSLGNYIWAIAMGGALNDNAYDVVVDKDDNVYLTGGFKGTVDFDPGPGIQNRTAAGSNDIFMAKFDTSGSLLWAHGMGSTGNDIGNDIAIDTAGNIILTGSFSNTVDFNPSSGFGLLSSNGLTDVFLAKYNAAGQYIWRKKIGGSSTDGGYGLAIDHNNNILTTGYFQSTVDFDPLVGTANLISSGSKDIYFAKYNENGQYLWAHYLHGSDGSLGSEIAVDSLGNSYLVGSFFATIDADPSAASYPLSSNGSTDIYLAKYNPIGNFLWAFSIGGPDWDFGHNLIVDANQDVAITGAFRDSMDIDPSGDSLELFSTTINYSNIYLAHYSSVGNLKWGLSLGGTNFDAGFAIANANDGDFCLSGHFKNTVDFDPGPGMVNRTALGDYDTFIAKFGASNCSVDYSTDNRVSCDSITWIDGITYTASTNSPTYTLTNAAGCDSIVQLDLSILQSTSSTELISACDSFTWIDGITYTSSTNSPTYTLSNAAGCDSIVQLDLSILQSTSSTELISACDSFTWIDGITYTSSTNSPTYTLTNAAGCDSIVQLDLSILQSTSSTELISACDSFTWIDGITYTTSTNSPTYTLTNAAGCDSLINLNLNLISVDTSVIRNGFGLSAQASNSSFQWLDCNASFAPITGANSNIFMPSIDGSYAVEIEQGNCIDTSQCFSILGLRLENKVKTDILSVYPNPGYGPFTVVMPNGLLKANLKVFDAQGRLVKDQVIRGKNSFAFDLNVKPGLYQVQIETELGIFHHSLIKNNGF